MVAGNQDSERQLQEGADLARKIGRPYLEVACLAELAFASKIEPFATTRRRCREATALAEQNGWGAEPVISPALVNLAGALIWTGEFDEGDYWLQRTARALETDIGPPMRLLLHIGTGMLLSGRRRQREALAEYTAAEHLQAQLEGSHALMRQLMGWRLATQARLGQLSEVRASLAALDAELAGSAEIGNARAVICLAEGNSAAALAAVKDVLGGAKRARTADLLHAITRQHVHRRPYPQVTVPQRTRAFVWVRVCCSTSMLYRSARLLAPQLGASPAVPQDPPVSRPRTGMPAGGAPRGKVGKIAVAVPQRNECGE